MPTSAIKKTTPTFNIKAHNGGGKFTINFEMPNCPLNYVGDITGELSKGFRDIEVVNSETGEIAMSIYFSDDMFQELCSPEMCIDMVRHICNKRGI
jgi:hypothetical protein